MTSLTCVLCGDTAYPVGLRLASAPEQDTNFCCYSCRQCGEVYLPLASYRALAITYVDETARLAREDAAASRTEKGDHDGNADRR